MESATPPFLGRHEGSSPLETARYCLLPLPWEQTVSWGGGTAHGPTALLEASQYLELWDEELWSEPWRAGIHTLEPPDLDSDLPAELPARMEAGIARIAAAARPHLAAGRRLLAIGGEHSVTPPLVKVALEEARELGVVQFDAHADLRVSYEGTPHSHACAMARVLELGVPTLSVGIRSLSPPEAERIESEGLRVLWGHEGEAALVERFADALAALPERVYLTFDLDYLDPSVLPATGTPEPGGGTWGPTLTLLRRLFASKQVVAADLVELAPIPGQPASDFTAAKLAYKMIGYWEEGPTGRGPRRR